MVDQFNNDANWKSHYHGTAEEIWQQSGASITTFVACLGTSGTLMGVSRKLRQLNPAVQIVGVEPYLGHKIQGLKNLKEAYVPGIYDPAARDDPGFRAASPMGKVPALEDGKARLADSAAMHEAKRLVAREPGRLAAYTFEVDVLESLKRVYYFTKRMARAALPSVTLRTESPKSP